MRARLSSLTAVITLTVAAPAFAQDADSLNEAGIEAFADGRFEDAAQSFAAAHAQDPDPIFRKSEAVAWFKAERCEPAVEAANAFLIEWQGGAAEADEAASVVANCKIEFAEAAMGAKSFDLAERLLFEAEEAARDSYTRDRVSQSRVELARLRREDLEARAVDDPIPAPPTPSNRAPVGAIATLATGAALVTAGAIWHVAVLTRTVPNLAQEANGGDRQRHEQLSRRVDVARVLVPTLYGVGLATTGLGVWLFIDRNETAGSVGAGHEASLGFSWSGHF